MNEVDYLMYAAFGFMLDTVRLVVSIAVGGYLALRYLD